MSPRRFAVAFGAAGPPIAAAVVVIAGAMSPGYDPLTRTISRLAVPGMAAAGAVDVAIILLG